MTVAPAKQATTSAPARRDTAAVVVAGGSGERFGDPRGKHLATLCGRPMLAWSLLALDRAPSVSELVIVCAPASRASIRDDVLGELALSHEVSFADGGATRQESVRAGLAAIEGSPDLIAIHDAARPLIDVEIVEGVLAHVRENPDATGAVCAAPVVDTLKIVEGREIASTPDRSRYWAVETPQVFRAQAIIAAHDAAAGEGFVGTDDASLLERQGLRVDVFETGHANIKVTYPEDLAIAETILSRRLGD